MESTELSFTKGTTYKDMGLYEEAIFEFEKAMAEEALQGPALREIAKCLVQTDRQDRAEKVLLQALCRPRISPQDRMWFNYDLANLYEGLGKYELALERLLIIRDKHVGLYPNLTERMENLRNKMSEVALKTEPDAEAGASSENETLSQQESERQHHMRRMAAESRRSGTRKESSTPVQYSFDQITWSTGYSKNVSRDGMLVLTHEPVPVGSVVFLKMELSIPSQRQMIEAIGHVVRKQSYLSDEMGVQGMGVQFVSIEPQHEESLNLFLKNLRSEEENLPPSGTELRFHCDACGRSVIAPESFSGRQGKCKCGEPFVVPFSYHYPTKENPLRGFHIAGCRIDRLIGTGSSGAVYKGHHLTLDIPVAIKILDPTHEKLRSEMADMFLKEARVVAKIDHPNIVSVMNAGETKDHRFIVMQYVSGMTLGQRLNESKALPTNDFISIFLDVCRALSEAHKLSIIHRDLKPDNILLSKGGRAMLVDFGMVKDLNSEPSSQEEGSAIGTPLYVSPEQARGEQTIDVRSDIYSLGATMFHALTGELPFKAFTVRGLLAKHCNEPVKPPSQVLPGVPEKLSELITVAMNKDPSDRFQTVGQISRKLLEASEELA